MKFKLRVLAVSLLALGINSIAFAKPVLVKSYKNIEEYKLDNDLQVILYENKKDNKVFMNTIYYTGSLNDPKGKGGLAHLLEHLAFKGTKNIPEDKFQHQLEQYTLTNNASTDYYVTQYTNEISPDFKNIQRVIALEAERMDGLVLQQKYVPTEIEIVKRERELTSDRAFTTLMDEAFKAVYGNESLGREPIGDLEDLQSIKVNELEAFYKTWYAPNNASIVITGNFDKAKVLNELDKQFNHKEKKDLPDQAYVKAIDLKEAKKKSITVKKGDSYQKVNFYITPRNQSIEPSLNLSPLLFTLEPSGHLYQSIVDTGVVNDVSLSPWTTRDFNMMLVAADYSSNQNVKKIEKALIDGIEKNSPFDDAELKRIQNVFKKSAESDFKDASQLGNVLTESLSVNQKNWIEYFNQNEAQEKLTPKVLNQNLKGFFQAKNRLETDILPTELKTDSEGIKALNHDQKLIEGSDKPKAHKDLSLYQKEVSESLKNIQTSLIEADGQIKKGTLSNGAQYALYKTETLDDQSYANIILNFGTAGSMQNQKQIIDFTAYLLMRGSEKNSYQDIVDRGIDVNGEVLVIPSLNSMEIKVIADKDGFEDYLVFVLEQIQHPTFNEKQFNIIKTRALNQLDRNFTEPDAVTKYALYDLTNHYAEGDLRFNEKPDLEKKHVEAVTLKQIKEFYSKYVKANQADIVVTGEFDQNKMAQLLEQQLGHWNGKEAYEVIENTYVPVKSQRLYLLAEPREFGSYRAFINVPLSKESADLPAMWVLSYILGESQLSSRLGQELREKNALVYSFYQALDVNEKIESGRLNIEANYTAGKADLVSQVVHNVFEDLIKNGVSAQEVEAAKAEILKQIATGAENPLMMHDNLGSQLKFKRNNSELKTKYQAVAKLNKEQVNAVIRKYIDLNNVVEIMADQYAKEK